MRRIAVINQKGGVGKTTTAVNLGAALARAGNRVLLIDLDPQAHLSLHVGQDPASGRAGTYELLTSGGGASIAKVRNKAGTNLWVVASSIDLAAAEVELVSVVGREVILRDLLDQHVGAATSGVMGGRGPQYDYVLMDCPPSLGVLTLNGLCAAREVFIPLQPHYLALQGLGKLLETVSLVSKRINPQLKVGGVVVCMHDSGTKLASEVIEDVRSFLESARGTDAPWAQAKLFDTFIRRNIKLAEAPSYGQSIFEYAVDSNGAKDYEQLAREVEGVAAEKPSPEPANEAAGPPLNTAAEDAPVPARVEAVVEHTQPAPPELTMPVLPDPIETTRAEAAARGGNGKLEAVAPPPPPGKKAAQRSATTPR